MAADRTNPQFSRRSGQSNNTLMSTLLLYALAFASGFAALVYQVAWSRMLSLTFGSSTLAVSAVVAGFMGGMGIGAWLYHRVGDRAAVPLRAYGWLEVLIAVSTAIYTAAFVALPPWFAGAAQLLPSGLVMDLTRVVTVFALLLVPAALMGATYPALCGAMIRTTDEVERRLGWIYGLNTIGAAIGAMAAGFVMIELLGSRSSVLVANAINLGVGIVALVMARRAAVAHGEVPVASDEAIDSQLPTWVTGVVLFGSGFATLGYEIVWFRALHYVMGPGTYALSTALVIFLAGLGLGGTLYRSALRIGRPEWTLGIAQLAIAMLALIAIGSEQWMLLDPEFSSRFVAFSALEQESWQTRVLIGFGISIAMLLPATLWMGVCFPLASRLFLGGAEHLTKRLGFAYLLSNLGSIVGAIGAAVLIMPTLGTVGATKLFAAVNVVLCVLVLHRATHRGLRLATAAGIGVVVLLAAALPERLAFQTSAGLGSESVGIAFEEESDRGTVQVFVDLGNQASRWMSIDGAPIASTRAHNAGLHDKQILLAHLPMSLDRSIEHTLNLGVASGSTLHTLAKYDWIETLDAVEINPAVIRGAEHFMESAVFNDPRAEIHVEDAVHYLLSTEKTYDLIVSDAKQDPRFGGNSKVLSKELYELSLGAMTECGLFVQFLTLMETEEYYKLILRTFHEAFPEMEVFVDPPFHALTIGSRCPIAGRARPTIAELKRTGVAREIESSFFPTANALPALWMASGDEIAETIGEGPVNSWDRLPLEFMSYRQPASHPVLLMKILRWLSAPRVAGMVGPAEFTSLPHFDELQQVSTSYIEWMNGEIDQARARIREVVARQPGNVLAVNASYTLTGPRSSAPKEWLKEAD